MWWRQTSDELPWMGPMLKTSGVPFRRGVVRTFAAKELHFNRSGETLKRMQAGVDKLASVVGVTLGPKVGAACSESITACTTTRCRITERGP
jgi:hypothetical protein